LGKLFISYNGGANNVQTTGTSGVQKSFKVLGLTKETAYTFNVSASDAATNAASNNPIVLNATTIADTSTPCSGFSSDALEGTFSAGYNYSFVTTGADVLVTFEILDTDKTGLVPQLYIEPATFYNMANPSGQTYTYNFTGQTPGAVLSFSLRAAYAGGLVRPKIFNYTVGDACNLSTYKFDQASFKAYPNPTNDTWTLTTNNTNISSIEVFDILGKNVLSLKPNAIEAKIETSGLKSGVYFAKVNTINGSSTLKLVKE